jgi:hypothetical protein
VIPPTNRHALMSTDTSRQNKLWLAIAWANAYPWFLEWQWAGGYMRSRLCFRFAPGDEFAPVDEDGAEPVERSADEWVDHLGAGYVASTDCA